MPTAAPTARKFRSEQPPTALVALAAMVSCRGAAATLRRDKRGQAPNATVTAMGADVVVRATQGEGAAIGEAEVWVRNQPSSAVESSSIPYVAVGLAAQRQAAATADATTRYNVCVSAIDALGLAYLLDRRFHIKDDSSFPLYMAQASFKTGNTEAAARGACKTLDIRLLIYQRYFAKIGIVIQVK